MVAINTVTVESQPIDTGRVPAVVLKLLTGSQAEGGRAAGVFTADDLIKILLYVRFARQLPQNLDDFVKVLGSNSTGIAGLEPSDIIGLYQQVTDHANRWTPVENLVKEQSSDLTIVSEDIVNTGGKIIEVINAMDVLAQMDTVHDTTATIPITSNKDQKIQTALPQVIDRLKQICLRQQEKSRNVLTAVRDYKTEISGGTLSNKTTVTGLEPAVADKKEKAKKADLGGRITELQNSIDSLQTEIEQLIKDYDKFVGLAFTGAAGGPIGLAITGGIFGAKAEEARKKKNDKIQEKESKAAELQRDQLVQGILNNFATSFTDLGMRLLDAEQALMHLDFLWTDIVKRIDQSVDKWNLVKNSDMLLTFVTDLNGIVNPWREVGDMSTKLVKVFDQAYEEFHKTYMA
jgi:hypothetical protein